MNLESGVCLFYLGQWCMLTYPSACMYGVPVCPPAALFSVGVTTAVLAEICLGRKSYESKRKGMVRKDNK